MVGPLPIAARPGRAQASYQAYCWECGVGAVAPGGSRGLGDAAGGWKLHERGGGEREDQGEVAPGGLHVTGPEGGHR